VNNEKAHILVIEDDLDIADMLSAYFRVQGYDVSTENWGEDGVRASQQKHPDIIILDIQLPDINGFEVANRLRNDRRTQNIPIIFLTERRERESRLKGLELQADDYITKPFDIQELRLRVRNTLERARRGTLTNPVTGIPESKMVDEQLAQCLQEGGWVGVIVMLENLSRFRDIYGFVASDDLLRAVILMIQDTLNQLGGKSDFLGHLTSSDFIIITKPPHVEALIRRISGRLSQSLGYFYREQDRDTDVFRGKHLAVKVEALPLDTAVIPDFHRLRDELEQRISQVPH